MDWLDRPECEHHPREMGNAFGLPTYENGTRLTRLLSPGESIIDPRTMKVTHRVVMRPVPQTPDEEPQEPRWRHYGVFVYSRTGRPFVRWWEILLIGALWLGALACGFLMTVQ